MQVKAILLARVSSKAQDDEGYSLDAQLKLMRDYCKSNGLSIIKEFRIAETASKQGRRKVFHELLLDIAKRRINHLVVEKTDRLTRNYKDAVSIDEWLEGDEKRVLHLVKENLQLHKHARSDAKFMLNIYLAFAKKYIDNLREEAMKGWAEKLAQGWLPAPPPVGYMTVLGNGKRIHVPNPDTALSVQKAFELYALPDHTTTTVWKEAQNMGLTTRKGRPLAKSAIHTMLNNPFYIGINRHGGREYPGAQEPIITKKLFDAVQAKLHKNSHSLQSRHNPIFKGMVYCASCNGMVTWQKQKGYVYGGCQRRQAACKSSKFLREDRLERKILSSLEEIKDPGDKILKMLESALHKDRHPYVGMHREKMITALTAQLTRLQGMDENLYEDKLAGEISGEKYKVKQQDLATQISAIQARIDRLNEVQEVPKSNIQASDSKNPIVCLYQESSPSQKRIILSSIFEDIVMLGTKVVFKRIT